MTKEQQFNQEDRKLSEAMDREAENKPKKQGEVMASIKLSELIKLREDNKILLDAMKEIAVQYPEDINTDSAEILCKYLIAKANEAVNKVEPETIHPIFQNIVDSIFPPLKRDL